MERRGIAIWTAMFLAASAWGQQRAEPFERGPAGGLRETRCPAGRVVLRSEAEWKQWWQRCEGPAPAAPDFSRHTAVGVFLGEKPHAGYAVKITDIRRFGQEVEVSYEAPEPDPDRMYAAVVTWPADVVLIRSTADAVRFRQVSPSDSSRKGKGKGR